MELPSGIPRPSACTGADQARFPAAWVAPGPLAHPCAGDPLAVAAAGGYWGMYFMTDAVGGILLGGA